MSKQQKNVNILQYWRKTEYTKITKPAITWILIINLLGVGRAWDFDSEGIEDLFLNVMYGGTSLSTETTSSTEGTAYVATHKLLSEFNLEKLV